MNNNNRNTECRERKKPPFAKKYTTFKSNHFGWSFSQFRNKSWINPVRNNPSPKNHRIQGSFGAINQVMIFVKCQINQMKEKMRKLLIKIKEKEMDERKSSTPSPSPTPSPNTFPSSSPPQSSDPSLSSKEESSSPTSSLSTTGERDQREDVGVSNPVAFLLSSHLNLKSPPSQPQTILSPSNSSCQKKRKKSDDESEVEGVKYLGWTDPINKKKSKKKQEKIAKRLKVNEEKKQQAIKERVKKKLEKSRKKKEERKEFAKSYFEWLQKRKPHQAALYMDPSKLSDSSWSDVSSSELSSD